jgi:hypothetical protein
MAPMMTEKKTVEMSPGLISPRASSRDPYQKARPYLARRKRGRKKKTNDEEEEEEEREPMNLFFLLLLSFPFFFF